MKRSIYKIENLSILMIYINLNKVEREPDNKLIEILKSNSTSARRKNKRLQFQRIQEKLRRLCMRKIATITCSFCELQLRYIW
jgi:hypothetical protein